MLANGSVLLAYRGENGTNGEMLSVASAPHWRGPYSRVTLQPIIADKGEDPWPWVDQRGNFHIIFHSFDEAPVAAASGGHAFSSTWEGPWTYGGLAYNNTVEWASGGPPLAWRERPQLYLDPTTLRPLVLYNGAIPGPDASSMASFTMASVING